MSGEILPIGAAVRQLRGPAAESERLRRIKGLVMDAVRRARLGKIEAADIALFGGELAERYIAWCYCTEPGKAPFETWVMDGRDGRPLSPPA